jgi:hypothetical protein
MLGLETLYARGNQNISEQIRTKVMLVFGEPAEFKKKLGKLYEYRSRLVHGDTDIPAKFSRDFQKFSPEYWNYLGFGSSILIASLRTLIHWDILAFQFDLKWADQGLKTDADSE